MTIMPMQRLPLSIRIMIPLYYICVPFTAVHQKCSCTRMNEYCILTVLGIYLYFNNYFNP